MRLMPSEHGCRRLWRTACRSGSRTDLENYSGQFKLRIPKSLHRSLAERARQEGISMNQYCVYLLSRNDAAAR